MRKVIALILVCLCIACGFVSCTETSATAVAIVIGIHENFPKIPFSEADIYNTVYEACYTNGNVFVVVSDGDPSLDADFDIPENTKQVSAAKRTQIAKQYAESVLYQCSTLSASSSEVDTLEAISIAADALRSTDCDVKKLLVIDSGLCTTGLLNQTSRDVIASDIAYTVNNLEKNNAVPHLDGVEVLWIGAGRVSGEQETLPKNYFSDLEKMWRTILEAGNATVEFDPYPISGAEVENLPSVTPVRFPKSIIDVIPKTEEPTKEEVTKVFEQPVKIDEETLKFIANRAEFVNVEDARRVVAPYAELLADNPDVTICIVGTTASAGDGYALSKRRAEVTRDIFLEYGVKYSQIICEGLGSSDNKFHVQDLDANGNLIESEAKKNRAIYFFSADSDTAKEFFNY